MTDQSTHSRLTTSALPGVSARHRQEKRFRALGLIAVMASLGFLAFFLTSIVVKGHGAFSEAAILLDLDLAPENLGLVEPFSDEDLRIANYRTAVRTALRHQFPQVSGRKEKRELYGLVGAGAEFELRDIIISNPGFIGKTIPLWLTASDDVDLYRADKGAGKVFKMSESQLAWYAALEAKERVKTRFSITFLTHSDSRDPENAGVRGAVLGSFFALMTCLILSFFVGIFAAIYLEEFAPKNRWTALLEVNINNLAAIPSIIFGLLGLAIFLGLFGLPRSAALVGGMVLSLMTLPTIIISSRVALQAVAPSIREAALGVGASHVQAVFHHVLPLAMPGMLTGTIIGMARALGETAPLLMIGMVAFIADAPSSVTDPASALPVQIYLWADSPERAFEEKTAGAIMVLLGFLVVMNLGAVLLRRKYEKKW